jgi:hypothetical protein
MSGVATMLAARHTTDAPRDSATSPPTFAVIAGAATACGQTWKVKFTGLTQNLQVDQAV